LRLTIERAVLENLTQDLVDRTLSIVQSVLDRANISSRELDDVLLVGGQSRSPHVRRLIVERFGRQPSKAVHPDEAVALGAAIVAEAVRANRPVMLTDLLPASIRIGTPGAKTQSILPRGARLPAGSHFEVAPEGRPGALTSVLFYRGEADAADENTFLGSIRFAPIASSAAANMKIKVTVNVSADGFLSVSARHPLTGEVKELEVSLVEEPATTMS
jgi:molecular chaperone DnaK